MQRITLPKKSSSNSCLAKKALYSTCEGAKGEEKEEATMEATAGSTSEATTGGGNRRGDRRIILNSKQQLRKFMSDYLNESLESLDVDW